MTRAGKSLVGAGLVVLCGSPIAWFAWSLATAGTSRDEAIQAVLTTCIAPDLQSVPAKAPANASRSWCYRARDVSGCVFVFPDALEAIQGTHSLPRGPLYEFVGDTTFAVEGFQDKERACLEHALDVQTSGM